MRRHAHKPNQRAIVLGEQTASVSNHCPISTSKRLLNTRRSLTARDLRVGSTLQCAQSYYLECQLKQSE